MSASRNILLHLGALLRGALHLHPGLRFHLCGICRAMKGGAQ